MNADPTARALVAAMHGVDGATADPHVVSRAQARARSARRRTAALIALAGISAMVAVGAAVAVRPPTGRSVSQQPAASAPRPAVHPRYAPAVLPAGFRKAPFSKASRQLPPQEDGRLMWEERLNYGRDFDATNHPKAVVTVSTVSGEVPTISPELYGDAEPDARWVTVGTRKVVHVRNMLDEPGGLDVYEWTEVPGINIHVTASGDVSGAEVRALIAALRRVQ